MWRLLSGIALILLLDIVFIWMMASEPDAPEIARAVGPIAASPIVHPPSVTSHETIDDNTEPDGSDDRTIRGSRGSRDQKRYLSRSTRRNADEVPTMSATAAANVFPDRIIWIGRTEVPVKIEREPVAVRTEVERNDEIQAEIAEERSVKKRSFQSKAIGVIKKPYELMKAFADKFN